NAKSIFFITFILIIFAVFSLQRCNETIAAHRRQLRDSELSLQEHGFTYKADIRVKRLKNGDYDVKKSIRLITIKP
ncbi:MAG: hypothetical protein AAF617_15470, partial [Bacteroidota bacterium]